MFLVSLYMSQAKTLSSLQHLWSDQLVSQSVLWHRIRESIRSGHFPHLSLMSADPGNVQLVLALASAQALLCSAEHAPCGICDSCRKVSGLIHSDLHFSFPLHKAKETCDMYASDWRAAVLETPFMGISQWFDHFGEDSKNANIAVKEVDRILGVLQLKPYESERKVLIIWLPEYLGKESNRLLKLFEEPPEETYIILVAESVERLLATVRSRAQWFRLQSLDLKEAAQFLAVRYHQQEELAYASLLTTGGHLQEAILQSDQEAGVSLGFLRKWLQHAYTYQVSGILEWVDEFSKMNRENQKHYLIWVQRLLSFVLRYKSGIEPEGQHPYLQYALKLSGSMNYEQIEQWSILLDGALDAIPRNANVKLLMTDLTIKLSGILRKKANLN